MTHSMAVGPVRIRPQIKNGAETDKWFVDVPASLTGNGKRKRKLFDNRKTALAAAKALRQAIDPVTGLILVQHREAGVSMSIAIDSWLQNEKLRVATLKKRPGTLGTNKYQLKPVREFFAGQLVASCTEQRLIEYQVYRLEQGRKPVTINSEVARIRQVLRRAVKLGWLKSVPDIEAIPVRHGCAMVPTPEEVVRIIDHLSGVLKILVRFLAETGCRLGEARNLMWSCVNECEGWTPKTYASERRVYLSECVLLEFRRLLKDGPYVFSGRNPQKPIGDFRKSWNKAVKSASIVRNGQTVHLQVKSLRKAHATWQAERGIPENVLQDRLGHAKGSVITRAYYIQTTDAARKSAVISLPASSALGPESDQSAK